MYPEPDAPHHYPHFHARYGEHQAVYRVHPVERLAGFLPRPQEELVMHWAKQRRWDLQRNWVKLQSGERPLPIKPLP
jgi:hypothetical protein